VECLFEDAKGNIYAASRASVDVFRPDEPLPPPPTALEIWEEYLVPSEHDTYRPLRDGDGNIWMCLKDHPGEFSRWDGYQWHHFKVPFDTSKVGSALVDDRGHVLFKMTSYPEGCFDVSPDGVKRYEDFEVMLVGAVTEGANRFFFNPREFYGCYVLEGRKIWYGYRNHNEFKYFDGERWDVFKMRTGFAFMFESPKYGILLRTWKYGYYAYDRGQILEIECPRYLGSRWILGPQNIQPFEEELLRSRPGPYTLVELGSDGNYYLLYGPIDKGVGQFSEATYVTGDVLPQDTLPLTPSCFDGYWMEQPSVGAPFRISVGRVFKCDFSGTPLAGREKDISLVLEDRAHNLWIGAGWDGRDRHVFLKHLSDFRLKIGDIPAEVKRSVDITAEPLLPGLEAKDLRIFWRLDGGLWRGGNQGNSATIRFPADGDYRIEVMGMDPQGGTSQVSTLVVNATVPLPETRLTDEGPYNVKDVVWSAPAEPVPSEPGCLPELAYRIDGGEWKLASDGKIVPMGGLAPGEHVVEIAAQEGEDYRDPTPLRLHVTYEPDFNFIVESRLDMIAGEDTERAARALSEIKMAGPEAIAVLREKLSAARRAARLAAALEKILRELEGGDGR
jgi:hypothetical protein